MVTRTSLPPYEEYINAIKPLWDSHWITNMGYYHHELEKQLKEYFGVSEISLAVNGHMALEMVLQAFDFPENGEVITTPFTFISTTHAIMRNHLKPVFCDVKLTDGTIDETKIEALITEKTVAIVPVHVYGNICNIKEIQKIANKHSIRVIYDAAHAFGIQYKNKGIGCYGDASIFSFHATKIFHTIEGGAVCFTEHGLYEKLYNLKNFGIRGEELVVDIGLNAKMNEFSAIMGLCNLKHIDKIFEERKKRYNTYIYELREIIGIKTFEKNEEATDNYAYFPILVDKVYGRSRDELYEYLQKNGVYSRKYFYPLTCDQVCFNNKYKNIALDNARALSEKVLVLPLYDSLSIDEVKMVVSLIRQGKR